ncbi:C-C motif chemokine 25 isoform X2 [Manis pentadactyla]|nr:C-C motif chemokine 25 isoform X2 [Manis pentadactyla]XP_036746529.1 C-C motif chemokine 25 isoform X2 [Manis pentadactyla]XP_036746531.1 C-C motif chemokine 25 isoform X2 [Manis pentadactyla]XP_057345702.1 C-C motif chemokine 25 isoform X2 [Manis pentadactyla]
MNMNLWLLTYLMAVFMGAWVPTVCSQGVFEDCCLAYHQHTGRAMLRRARGYLLQEIRLAPHRQDGVWEPAGQVGAEWGKTPGCSEQESPKAPRCPESLPRTLSARPGSASTGRAGPLSATAIAPRPRLPVCPSGQISIMVPEPELAHSPSSRPPPASQAAGRRELTLFQALCLLWEPESACAVGLIDGHWDMSPSAALATHPGPCLPMSPWLLAKLPSVHTRPSPQILNKPWVGGHSCLSCFTMG